MWCIVKKKEITKRLNLNEHVKRRIFKHTIESIWIFIRSPIYDKQTFQQSRLNVPNILVSFHPQLFGHASTYLEQQHGPLQILILKFHSLLFSSRLLFVDQTSSVRYKFAESRRFARVHARGKAEWKTRFTFDDKSDGRSLAKNKRFVAKQALTIVGTVARARNKRRKYPRKTSITNVDERARTNPVTGRRYMWANSLSRWRRYDMGAGQWYPSGV